MKDSFLLFGVIFVFISFILEMTERMTKDKNVAIRFLGYFIAAVAAIGVLWVVLYCYFDINLLEALPL